MPEDECILEVDAAAEYISQALAYPKPRKYILPAAHRDRLAIARSVSLAHDCARLSFAVLELR